MHQCRSLSRQKFRPVSRTSPRGLPMQQSAESAVTPLSADAQSVQLQTGKSRRRCSTPSEYLARTLANKGTPEIHPMNVRTPNTFVRDAQINGIIRKLRLPLRSSATPLVCRKHRHLFTPGRLLVHCKTRSTSLWWTTYLRALHR